MWRVEVGRVPLFLLDTDFPENGMVERWITARLYDSDEQTRLAQYVLLGVGGIRALRAVGIEPSTIHLNEGHAALAPVELAARDAGGGPDAVRQPCAQPASGRCSPPTRQSPPATTATHPGRSSRRSAATSDELGWSASDVIALGRTDPEDPSEPFGVTQAALRMSRAANAVSRRHGEVAREMWHSLWPERAVEEVPIGHVTNGVHIPTWIGAPMRELLDRHLGEDWWRRAADPQTWTPSIRSPTPSCGPPASASAQQLVSFVRERSVTDRLARNDVREYVSAAAHAFDPAVLTIGFARRVATYKRLELLIRDPEWTMSLLDGERPVQVVLAGKAHPRDEEAKRSLQRLFGLKYARVVGERVVFLDDYDLASAARLVRGCDVWLNLPRPPLEASGTSGMKSAVNGGLQLSVLDGWWAEAYQGDNGWALPGDVDADPTAQDERDAQTLHELLDGEVVPTFYARNAERIPARWLAVMRASLRSIAPRFSASRMLSEYVAGPYRGS